jgi:protein-disulfide isomerase
MNTRVVIGMVTLALAGCVPMEDFQMNNVTESGATVSAVSSAPVQTTPTGTGTLLIGDSDASVTMLLFTNYNCAYCSDFEQVLMPRLQMDFIESGKLNIQIIPLPLQKYPDSDRNARILLCGVRVGSGSDVHRQLFTGRKDFPALKTCLDDDAYLQRVMAEQYETIRSLEVTLVPTYVINGEKFVGLPAYADLRGQIETELRMKN